MITHALEKEAENAAWDIWIAVYPNFTEETFIPFADFKAEQLKKKPRKVIKTPEEIIKEMTAVVEHFEQRKR